MNSAYKGASKLEMEMLLVSDHIPKASFSSNKQSVSDVDSYKR
jgi:hypothetical protein